MPLCPLCNGLEKITDICPACFGEMVDGGCLSDYLGPYSPYENKRAENNSPKDYCIHLIYCPVCRYDTRLAAHMVTI